jgi:hypothetical protein
MLFLPGRAPATQPAINPAQRARALRRAVSVYDRADRRRIYGFNQRTLTADIPYDFLWQTSEIDVIPEALSGYEPSAVGGQYNSVAHWRP